MRALVTGSAGFVGPYLLRSLEKDGWTTRQFDLRFGEDIRNYEQVRAALEQYQPDAVYHLAAVAWPGESIIDPRRTMDVNLGGALNLLEAMRTTGSDARVLLAGTSEEYGYEGWPDGYILSEDSPARPTTPYGVSKLAQTTLGLAYARRYGMKVVATRAFNHTGAGRQAVNAESAFARRIVAVERGMSDVVEHGDLSAQRNFTNVRDVVAAYRIAIGLEPGIYNVCGPDTVSMEQVLHTLITMSKAEVIVTRKVSGLGRPDNATKFPVVRYKKLVDAGWVPDIPLHESLAEVLEYWRSR